MADRLDDSAPFNDDQGTRVSEPTGAGAEATESTGGEPRGKSHEHRGGYGGEAGEPKEPNRATPPTPPTPPTLPTPRTPPTPPDIPTSRR